MLEWICRISSLVIFPTRGVENIKITVFSISNNLIGKMFPPLDDKDAKAPCGLLHLTALRNISE